jgi:hypothetical protein
LITSMCVDDAQGAQNQQKRSMHVI